MSDKELYHEQELLRQVSEGDQSAFTELFMRHRGKIYHAICRLTGSTTLAEEILLDVFLIIWVKRESLEEINNFEAYLHTIARRNTYRALKQLAKERQLMRSGIEGHERPIHLTGESLLQEKQYNTLLQDAVDRLPLKQRETFILIRREGLKREEAATRLGVSPETVKYNLEEAIRKIRAYCLTHGDFTLVVALLFGALKK